MDIAAQLSLEKQLQQMAVESAKDWMRFAQNKKLLSEYWVAKYSNLEPRSSGEILHCIVFGVSPLCKQGNHQNFKQFPQGYFAACGLGRDCTCKKEVRVEAIKDWLSSDTTEMKQQRKEKQKATMREKHGVENAFQMRDHKLKSNNTKLEKYGTTDITKIPGVMESKRRTSQRNYGVDHHSRAAEVRTRTHNTVLEKYGGDIPLACPEVAAKATATIVEKYGVENYFHSAENQDKIKNSRLANFGYANPGQRNISADTLAILQNKELFSAAVENLSLEMAARTLGVSAFTIANYADQYAARSIMSIGSGSVDQTEIANWIKSLGVRVECNVRSIISPKEIDIFLPEFNLGIEYNGAYYHSEVAGGKNSKYHREKYLKCAEKGVKLLQICSISYKNKPEIIRGILRTQLGKNSKIAARKCAVRQVDYASTVTFLEENHLQTATTTGSVRLGLYYNNELVQLLTFGKGRKSLGANSKANSWELIRMVSKVGHTVVGGTSKLFAYFLHKYSPTEIISYSDLRYFSGSSLLKLGFELINSGSPGYWYTADYKTLHHRYNFRKQELIKQGADSALSEWAIMQAAGYDRIWDCGHAKYKWVK